jgi:hypothetical protein
MPYSTAKSCDREGYSLVDSCKCSKTQTVKTGEKWIGILSSLRDINHKSIAIILIITAGQSNTASGVTNAAELAYTVS